MSRRRLLQVLAALAGVALLGAADAFWLEPRVLLVADRVRIELDAPPLSAVHLSDLHVAGETALLRRLLKQVAGAAPDVILLSGDLVHDVPDPAAFDRNLAAARDFAAGLRAIAPVYAVQGHSDYQGRVVAGLAGAGLEWLSNRGRWIGAPEGGAPGSILLLGVNQQVGEDAYVPHWHPPFGPVDGGGRRFYGAVRGLPYKDFYSHYDPRPRSLTDEGGPLAWSGYETLCDAWIDGPDVGAGIAVHSRYVLGEDRMIRLRRVKAEAGRTGSFFLLEQGSELTGQPDTGVDPLPGRWYRLRLRTAVSPGSVRVLAKAWPAAGPEPARWQAWGEDRSPLRSTAGTVGLGAWGGGTVLYRNLRVTAGNGRVLLDQPFDRASEKGWSDWRQGTRATRLQLALARSPQAPPGTPRVVLAHSPDVAAEASRLGLEAVLAGHTHGGQVRLPFVGALLTRTYLGPAFDRGLFALAAPNRRGWTWLYVNSGIGTSLLPLRFDCPPSWTVVEMGRQ
ncbi:MAG TPA: metallophosphoesterase [Thermoanaerobaculia bacterium]|nr:metallophosphoesterase [Thermoanaerobaculia bacterium]